MRKKHNYFPQGSKYQQEFVLSFFPAIFHHMKSQVTGTVVMLTDYPLVPAGAAGSFEEFREGFK